MAVVYLTTNNIDGKKYIGVDSKNNPEYLGSGKILKRSINKYGRENFTKEILFEFDTEEDAYLKEIELISELSAVESEEYYNIHPGGKGGWSHFKTSGEDNPMYGKNVRDIFISKYGEDIGNSLYDESRLSAGKKSSVSLKGKKKTEEHRNNLSIAKKIFWESLPDEEKILRREKMSRDMKSANIKRSDEYKEKMSQSLKKISDLIHQKKKCEFCGREMNIQNIIRWHGNKCKNRNNN